MNVQKLKICEILRICTLSSMQKVKTAGFSETLVLTYLMTTCHIPGHNPATHQISLSANNKLGLVIPMNLLQNCLQYRFMKTIVSFTLTATKTSNNTSRFKSTLKLIYIMPFKSITKTKTGLKCFDTHLETGDRSHNCW
jgi:hypothetical protein